MGFYESYKRRYVAAALLEDIYNTANSSDIYTPEARQLSTSHVTWAHWRGPLLQFYGKCWIYIRSIETFCSEQLAEPSTCSDTDNRRFLHSIMHWNAFTIPISLATWHFSKEHTSNSIKSETLSAMYECLIYRSMLFCHIVMSSSVISEHCCLEFILLV